MSATGGDSPLARETSAPNAELVEVFSGIQGEGPLVGYRQIFTRFARCNLRCRYCDTREAWRAPNECLLERVPGRRDWERARNPLSRAQLLRAVERLARPRLHHAVAVTGGEPLLQADFLAGLLPELRAMGLRILLETNGALPEELSKVVAWVDFIAMDIKLASATGAAMPTDAHRRFLRGSAGRGLCVKMVITAETTADELALAGALVAEVDARTPVILQPATPGAAAVAAPAPEQVLLLQESLADLLPDVRVIPQTHKLMGQK